MAQLLGDSRLFFFLFFGQTPSQSLCLPTTVPEPKNYADHLLCRQQLLQTCVIIPGLWLVTEGLSVKYLERKEGRKKKEKKNKCSPLFYIPLKPLESCRSELKQTTAALKAAPGSPCNHGDSLAAHNQNMGLTAEMHVCIPVWYELDGTDPVSARLFVCFVCFLAEHWFNEGCFWWKSKGASDMIAETTARWEGF